MASLGTLPKDPDEVITFYMDWSARLLTQHIVSSSWVVPTGLVLETHGVLTGNTTTSLTLSGGTARTQYHVTNTVTTSTGQVWQRTGTVLVRET